MACFTGWLFYLQAAVIGAFCQFCLLSADLHNLFLFFLISLLTSATTPRLKPSTLILDEIQMPEHVQIMPPAIGYFWHVRVLVGNRTQNGVA